MCASKITRPFPLRAKARPKENRAVPSEVSSSPIEFLGHAEELWAKARPKENRAVPSKVCATAGLPPPRLPWLRQGSLLRSPADCRHSTPALYFYHTGLGDAMASGSAGSAMSADGRGGGKLENLTP